MPRRDASGSPSTRPPAPGQATAEGGAVEQTHESSVAEELPVDVAAWIDEHDPVLPTPPDEPADDDRPTPGAPSAEDPVAVERVLDEQRAEHEPDRRDANGAIGALVNNTGDDGGAASG